jgi:hypothetical protein
MSTSAGMRHKSRYACLHAVKGTGGSVQGTVRESCKS